MSKISRKADIIFDALAAASPDPVISGDLLARIAAAGFKTSRQTVPQTMMYLRRLLSADGNSADTEVITCVKRGKDSEYRLALTPEDALVYRQHRVAVDLVSEIRTIETQIKTERERFGGVDVFSQAALDYLQGAIRELERAASMSVMATTKKKTNP